MKYWIVKPRDTSLFRDARPFVAGTPSISLGFPWPSTLVGFLRSRLGMREDGVFEWTPSQAREVAMQGPWLGELDTQGLLKQCLFPAPLDCVLFRPEDAVDGVVPESLIRRRLGPLHNATIWSDLDVSLKHVGFLEEPEKNPGKPAKGPAFWSESALEAWLHEPSVCDEVCVRDLGIPALPRERRTRVKITSDTRTVENGMLSGTEQLRFDMRDRGVTRRFALVIGTQDDVNEERMLREPGTLGGDRRLAFVSQGKPPMLAAPTLLPGEDIVRVVLLTPAIFDDGCKPSALPGGATVIAARVERYEPISGWSFEHKGPKPTRRMCAAGSVFWVKVPGGEAQIWTNKHHMTSIASDAQDRLDGFGLIACGRP